MRERERERKREKERKIQEQSTFRLGIHVGNLHLDRDRVQGVTRGRDNFQPVTIDGVGSVCVEGVEEPLVLKC